MFYAIKNLEPKWEKYMSVESIDLLQGLLAKDPSKRLGTGPTGIEKIKAHPWFDKLDFDKLIEKKLTPPIKPKIKAPHDTSNIDPVIL